MMRELLLLACIWIACCAKPAPKEPRPLDSECKEGGALVAQCFYPKHSEKAICYDCVKGKWVRRQ